MNIFKRFNNALCESFAHGLMSLSRAFLSLIYGFDINKCVPLHKISGIII